MGFLGYKRNFWIAIYLFIKNLLTIFYVNHKMYYVIRKICNDYRKGGIQMECNDFGEPKVKRGLVKKLMIGLSILSIITVVAAVFFLPSFVDYYQGLTNRALGYPYLVFLWITGVPFIAMLIYFLLISLSLNREKIFADKVLRYIGSIQVCLLIEMALYIYGVIWYRLVVTMVILFGVLILLVLATLFKEVVRDGKEYYTDSRLSV